MEKGYYKPELDEFCVGVDCECWNNGNQEWKKEKCEHFNWFNLRDYLRDDNVRVKLLDRADIEAEGFEWRYTDDDPSGFITKPERLVFSKSIPDNRNPGRTLLIRCFYVPASNWMIIDKEESGNNLFVGRIRNRNEFRKLLKQIGI